MTKFICSCNTLGILQLELCGGASGRGKEGCEGCCRGDFGIPTLFVRSGTRVCLAFENLRLPEAAVSLLAEHRRALCRVGQADVGHRVPPPAFSGLTAGTAPSQGKELLLRFLRKRCSLI